MKRLPAKPWLFAMLTLGVALVPVWLGWKGYREEARRRDAQLFEATSGLAGERLQLITVRHLNLFNVLRNQLRSQPVPARESLPIPPTFSTSFPHLLAFGYADAEEGRVILRWTSADHGAPAKVGADLSADPRLAALLERARQSPSVVSATDSPACDRAFVAEAIGDATRIRRFVVGWVDIASLCRDTSIALFRDGVLTAAPLDENGPPPAGARTFHIREGGSEFTIAIARGPRFDATYGPVAPTLIFTAGAGCAVLLAFLVFSAVRTSQLRAALDTERMRGQLVQSFSHEFRTPLSVILSSADLLEAGGDRLSETRRSEAIAQIQDATRRLSEMAEEILLLGRLESQRPSSQPLETELAPLCETLARETAVATRNRCRIEIAATGTALLDPTLVRVALANLLSNAVKYSPLGALVRLSSEHRNGTLIFTVTDSGIGIPMADLPRLGEPFHRAANVGETPGTGLGLAIVRRSAALLGGNLNIESREGEGTTATLTIPAA